VEEDQYIISTIKVSKEDRKYTAGDDHKTNEQRSRN
jgi:hypothetical protein